MVIHSARKVGARGGVLVVTLFMACLFGLFLFSYLALARNQRALVTRSQAWNGALTVAEAGVEEALAQLNPGAPAPVIDRTANGWGSPSGGLYGPVTHSVPGGYYSVVYDSATFPTIYATGYVSVPSIPAVLKRTVCVTTTNRSLFPAALVAKININLRGNGIATDSFNSLDPNLSNNGMYDPTRASTNGDIGSIQGIVNVGNADVNGKVLLGPTATNFIGANGVVTGGVYYDLNMELEDVVLPQTSWLIQSASSPTVTIGTNSYSYVFLNSGDYQVSSLSGNVYVGTNANVRLLVKNNSNVGLISVVGTGSSAGKLTLYMDGASFSLSGAAVVDSGRAANFGYFGTTNNTSVSMGGNAAFAGTIYAPEASFQLGGGGNSVYDCVGAVIAMNVTMNGHFKFHYDESLLLSGFQTGFIAASWREL